MTFHRNKCLETLILKLKYIICDDPWEKGMLKDVNVLIQVRFVPELGRQRLLTRLFPTDHHIYEIYLRMFFKVP